MIKHKKNRPYYFGVRRDKVERYKRNYSSISEEEQKVIGNTTVAIVGLGGLGGYVLEGLARIGIRKFHLIDKDVFEITNLNRQLLCTEYNLGESKVAEGLNRILKINPSIEAKVFNSKLDENSVEIIRGVDIVVDCLDSIEGRFHLESLCEKLNLPLIHGAIRGYYGQVAISRPNNRIFSKIYGMTKNDNESLGNLVITCMVIASFQVNLLLRLVFNESVEDELILIDCKNMEIEKIEL
jgi:molybdopterin/thiamine biosynthesis adenylyltransferase